MTLDAPVIKYVQAKNVKTFAVQKLAGVTLSVKLTITILVANVREDFLGIHINFVKKVRLFLYGSDFCQRIPQFANFIIWIDLEQLAPNVKWTLNVPTINFVLEKNVKTFAIHGPVGKTLCVRQKITRVIANARRDMREIRLSFVKKVEILLSYLRLSV